MAEEEWSAFKNPARSEGLVPPQRDETLHNVHRADDKKAPRLA